MGIELRVRVAIQALKQEYRGPELLPEEAGCIGQIGHVRYDPRRPDRSVWLGRE